MPLDPKNHCRDCGRVLSFGAKRCRDCFAKTRRGVRAPLDERFWAKVAIGSKGDCWEWKAAAAPRGYGRINVEGRVRLAHRLAYELTHKVEVPSDLCVCHRCDNPSCVNPSHLWLGTKAENNRDMGRKGRAVIPGLRGEQHPNARIPDGDIDAMRDLVSQGWVLADIARAYGVDRSYVWRLKHGLSRSESHSSSERVDGLAA
jgi:hypothetical protein